MYIIETHHKHSAHSQIVLEKGDDKKPYNDFIKHRVVLNHSGDVDMKFCKWCFMQKKATHVIAL